MLRSGTNSESSDAESECSKTRGGQDTERIDKPNETYLRANGEPIEKKTESPLYPMLIYRATDHEELNNRAKLYSRKYRRHRELDEFEKALEYRPRELEVTPNGCPQFSFRHDTLGLYHGDRFQRLGELDDLEKELEHFSHALELTPDGHPDLPRLHDSLGVCYTDRFQRLGKLADFEKALKHDSRALELTPDGHPHLLRRHASLGVSYGDRFQLLGELADLQKELEHFSRALELTPDGHPHLPRRHNTLGTAYISRFHWLRKLADLEKALEHFSRALELTPDGHPDLPRQHDRLGVSYTARFRRLGELSDLEKALEHKSRALKLTPEDDSWYHLSGRHASLGASYADRFKRLGELADLEKALKYDLYALGFTSERNSERPTRYFNQAQGFHSQYKHTRNPSHLQASMQAFRNASQLLTGSPHDKLKYAIRWATVASSYISSSPTCIEAFQTAIALLSQAIALGATTTQSYYDLSAAANLAVNSARTAIIQSDYRLALEWLEHTRCVVWNQSIMLKSPVNELQTSHPDLAIRFQTVSRQLHAACSEPSSGPPPFCPVGRGIVYRDRYRLSRKYAALIAQIRNLPGHESFLRPMKADRLVLAAQYGPIAMINCHKKQCDALLILPGQGDVMHLPLPNFTQETARAAGIKLQSALRLKGLRDRGAKPIGLPGSNQEVRSVLKALWLHIVKPVLDFLRYTISVRAINNQHSRNTNITLKNSEPSNNLPHITWCPTGALSFLPLHAAGDYDHPESRVFDYAISSYTPTLTALLASSSAELHRTSRVLAVGQEHTPGHSPLPGTTDELGRVKEHALNRVEYVQLTGNEATTTEVLDAMERHDWVHLACHALQNISDPRKSGFYLHDGTLDLASINRRSFSNKGLAFLSACQTATGDQKLPDEAIHLASGMLMAGYPSVIATMWSVMDADAPLVADKVYAELLKGGRVGNGEAGKALHHAVSALRDKVGEKEFVRWVPYIHMGR